mmetsp:Transcript_14521/g.34372  ORF Transcript_14521/g.34372 Transcript_14521/m.34372 type:complete len:322 (-) Transcript_14521:880-1845(-)
MPNPLSHRLPAQVHPQGAYRHVAAQERQRPGARHQVRQQHHGPHGMGLWLPSDARWAGADHLRPVLLHHHLRPHAPRGHRSAQGGAHVPHRAGRQHRHVHHRRARRALRRRLQARPHAAGGLRAPLLQPDRHLHLVQHLAAAPSAHPPRQGSRRHHGQVPLVRPRVPRSVLLHRAGHLHGLLARGRRAAAHRPARDRRPLPLGAGRHLRGARRIRLRQDGHLAGPLQVLQLRLHHLRRLRRARQRDGRGAQGLPRAHDGGRREGREHHEADHARRQHLQHARRRARGLHLHGHHPGRVHARHGYGRRHDGRLHLALGRGAA